MSENNGKPLPFRPPAGVPIIGQPFALKTWNVSVVVACQCPAKEPVFLVAPGAVNKCPACGRGFVLQGMNVNNGQIGFAIGLVATEPADLAAGSIPS